MAGQKGARLRVVLSFVIFGTIGLFVRGIPLPSGELALYRAVMAALLIGLYLAVGRRGLSAAAVKGELLRLLVSGAALGINWILLFEAYRYTTVSVATLSYYFAPVIVTAACPILFRERLTPKQILCFAASTAGLALVIGVTDPGQGTDLRGILFGLGAAVFYASVILINKSIRGVAGLHRTLLQFLAAIVVLLPYVACTSGFHPQALDGRGWVCLLVVGIVHTGVAYCLYFSAIEAVTGQQAALLSYVDPLVAVVVSVTVLGEPATTLQLVGGGILLGFTLLNEVEPKKRLRPR